MVKDGCLFIVTGSLEFDPDVLEVIRTLGSVAGLGWTDELDIKAEDSSKVAGT